MRRFRDARRARYARLLHGSGLEIGALTTPLQLPNADRVLYSDVLSPEDVERLYPGARTPDIVSDSETFPSVADATFDFVVANHVLEHVSSPITALREWHRMLKPGGLLYLAIPDKRHTFDRTRKRTTLQHLVDDYRSEATSREKNYVHLLEWAEHVERLDPHDKTFHEWVESQAGGAFTVHNHVWVLSDIIELFRFLYAEGIARFALRRWSNTPFLGNEFILVLEAHHHPNDSDVRKWRRLQRLVTGSEPLQIGKAKLKSFLKAMRGTP
jgi:SAM-dependent methyltransferase